MTPLDWAVVLGYVLLLLGIGQYFSRRQATGGEYFLGGRGFKFWEIGLSTMATQLSAVSFISAPAFVGLRAGGGLEWLTYEFAVPLAMVALITIIIPPLYRSGVVSIYAFLESRFGVGTRLLISAVFLLSRAFATGIKIYALALVLSAVLGIPVWGTILMAGGVTIVYSVQGGMKAVVYTDVLQIGILSLGILACTAVGLSLMGGWSGFVAHVDPARLHAVDFGALGLGDGREFGYWPMVIGGFFLYASYYGCDQSQAQRSLSGRDLGQVRGALVFNGLLRFPLTFLYCGMGLVLGTVAATRPAFRAMIPNAKPDMLVPVFISEYLPHGLVGLLIIAVLSAGMSAMSATINSLAAASTEDFVVRARGVTLAPAAYLRTARHLTWFWGVCCVVFAFAAGNIASTVIEAINKVGSLFYGPILATFALAILVPRVRGRAVNVGIILGVLVNAALWVFAEKRVFWFWWNAIGFVVTIGIALGASAGARLPAMFAPPATMAPATPAAARRVTRETALLFAYFAAMVAFTLALPRLFTR